GQGGEYMWDELAAAAWIDPTLITRRETRYMSIDLYCGAGYGNTLTWCEKDAARLGVKPIEVQVDLDNERFNRMFVKLMTAATPTAREGKIFNRKGRQGRKELLGELCAILCVLCGESFLVLRLR